MEYLFYYLSSSSDPSNVRYVGVTSRTLKQRFSGHKYNAIHKEKRTQPVHKWMWSELQKGNEIKINLIEEFDGDWEEREKYWIKYYKDLNYDLLNVSEGGCGVITKEMRDISGIERSIEAHKKKIVAIDKTTKKIFKKFDSIREAFKFFKEEGKYTSISNALNKRAQTSHGYYWFFQDELENNSIEDLINDIKKELPKHWKTIYQFDLNGNMINKYDSQEKALDSINMNNRNSNGIRGAIDNKRLYHDYYWSLNDKIDIEEYRNINFPYVEFDNDKIINRYRSLEEISKKFSISPTQACILLKRDGFLKVNNHKIIKIKI